MHHFLNRESITLHAPLIITTIATIQSSIIIWHSSSVLALQYTLQHLKGLCNVTKPIKLLKCTWFYWTPRKSRNSLQMCCIVMTTTEYSTISTWLYHDVITIWFIIAKVTLLYTTNIATLVWCKMLKGRCIVYEAI